jgi:hypothetical protein
VLCLKVRSQEFFSCKFWQSTVISYQQLSLLVIDKGIFIVTPITAVAKQNQVMNFLFIYLFIFFFACLASCHFGRVHYNVAECRLWRRARSVMGNFTHLLKKSLFVLLVANMQIQKPVNCEKWIIATTHTRTVGGGDQQIRHAPLS